MENIIKTIVKLDLEYLRSCHKLNKNTQFDLEMIYLFEIVKKAAKKEVYQGNIIMKIIPLTYFYNLLPRVIKQWNAHSIFRLLSV